MPTFSESKVPYELLARWGQDGKLAGVHVGFRTITKRDDVVIADTPDAVQPVALGAAAGFPLSDILTQLHADAIAKGDALTVELAVNKTELSTASTAITQLQADAVAANDALTAKTAELAAANAVIAEMQPQVAAVAV